MTASTDTLNRCTAAITTSKPNHGNYTANNGTTGPRPLRAVRQAMLIYDLSHRALERSMKLARRRFLYLAAGLTALPAASRVARAQAYPTRPVRLFEGFGGGSTADIGARLIGQWLSERLGQPFVVENRTGAGSNIATEAVIRAPPDGYTLLTCVTANAINATLYEKLNFNFIRDIAPVAGLFRLPLVMLVNQLLPAKTLPEFIAYAKANPGKMNMASPGNGSGPMLQASCLR